jgi:hypothetical protein
LHADCTAEGIPGWATSLHLFGKSKSVKSSHLITRVIIRAAFCASGCRHAGPATTLTRATRTPDGYEYSTLYWNLRRLHFYIENNAHTLVNYGMRYHKGLPISSGIAESAVKLVVSHRTANKQQMRWTGEGAYCPAQVRVAVFKKECSV